MLDLYYFPNATCGVKARLALNEKQVAFTRRVLNRDKGDLNTPTYRALNPNGVVPTLVHDDHVLIESSIIMAYVDDAFDGPSLSPDTALGRAEMMMWLKLVDEHYFSALASLTYATSLRARILGRYRTQEEIEHYLSHMASEEDRDRRRHVLRDGPASAEARKAIVALDAMLARMNQSLATQDFLCGDHYTLADAALTPFLSRLDLLTLNAMWTERYPHCETWWSRIKSRPSFEQEAMSDVNDDYRRFTGDEGMKAWPILRGFLEFPAAEARASRASPGCIDIVSRYT